MAKTAISNHRIAVIMVVCLVAPVFATITTPGIATHDERDVPSEIYLWDYGGSGMDSLDEIDHEFECGYGNQMLKHYLAEDVDEPTRTSKYCTTGEHNWRDSIRHGVILTDYFSFTGFVESVLSYEDGERRWRCEFSHGSWRGCNGTGSFPAEGVEFCHDGWAYKNYDGGVNAFPLIPEYMEHNQDCQYHENNPLRDWKANSHPPKGFGTDTHQLYWRVYLEHE